MVTAQRRTYRADDMGESLAELLMAGDKALNTRSPLYPLAEWLAPCTRCGAEKKAPCVPHDGPEREERALRNHASHAARRRSAAQHLSSLLAEHVSSEAG